MLAEYNSLRQESMSSITNRILIANFVFGALGLIIAALIAQKNPTVITAVLAAIGVPQIAKVGLMIWLGEYNRSQRAGKWISTLEQRISKLLQTDRVIAWESDLMSGSIHMSYPYLSVVLLLLGVGWLGIGVGESLAFGIFGRAELQFPVNILSSTVLVVLVVWELVFVKYIFWRKWIFIKQKYAAGGDDMWLGQWDG